MKITQWTLLLCLVLSSIKIVAQDDLSGDWIDKKSRAKFFVEEKNGKIEITTSNGNKFTGTIRNNTIDVLFKYKSLNDVPANFTPETRNAMMRDGIVMKGTVAKSPLNTAIIKLDFYRAIYAAGRKTRDSIVPYELLKSPIQFVNRQGKPVRLVSDMSHPYPVITLDEISAGQVSVRDGKASFTISGKVTDAIADIVKDKADIKTVTLSFIDLYAEDDKKEEISIPVTKQASSGTDSWKPYPFEGKFKKEVTVPVWEGQIAVTVKTTNVAGNTGYDGFTLVMNDNVDRVTDINHQKGTDEGLFNPIKIKIYDPEPPNIEASFPDVRLMNGKNITLEAVAREGTGVFQSELPFIALSRTVKGGIDNIMDSVASIKDNSITYRNYKEDFYWSYTTHSPANYFTYAGGTTVDHEVRSNLFSRWDLERAVVKYDNNGPQVDNFISTRIKGELPGGDGNAPGYLLELTIRPTSGLLGTKKTFEFTLKEKNGNRRITADEASIGAFKVLHRIKVVLVTVDGLAWHSFDSLMHTGDKAVIPTFKKLFEDGYNMERPALSALPTITWCNWPGIFSMQRPADHGVIGNAFLGRETRNATPLATGVPGGAVDLLRARGVSYDALQVAKGKLATYAKTTSGSLYDRVATAFNKGSKLDVLSVNQWYFKSSPNLVTVRPFNYVDRKRYGVIRMIEFKEHSESAARLNDRASGKLAAEQFVSSINQFDVLTVYFPGPDNIAHAIGQEPNELSGSYPPGPAIPHDNFPLYAIKEHLIRHGDRNLNRLISQIEEHGYLYATLFAITGDHGLHAFQNKDEFNLTLYQTQNNRQVGMASFFTRLGFNPWEVDTVINTPDGPVTIGENINDQTLVYAPNGGMAHIYLRSQGRTWQQAPTKKDIDSLARRLFIEAVAGGTKDPNTGVRVTYPHTLLYPNFWSKPNTSLNGADYGALGSPPALFVKEDFTSDFRWVKFVNPTTGVVQYGTLQEFLAARATARDALGRVLYPGFNWPEFIQRMDEMNDKNPGGSRTGDIVFFTDGYTGYLSVNNTEGLNGWHGGPSRSESFIPLLFNIPGNVVTNKTFIQNAVNSAYEEVRAAGRTFRNWDLGRILVKILDNLYAGQ